MKRSLPLAALLFAWACDPGTLVLGARAGDDDQAALQEQLDDLAGQVAALSAQLADQDARMLEYEATLAECLNLADNAMTNATAAQERVTDVEAWQESWELDWVLYDLPYRVDELEDRVEKLEH